MLELAWDRGVQVHPNVYGSVFGICAREREYDCVLRAWDAKAASDYERMPWEYTSALLAAVHLKKNERVFGMLDEVKANQVTDDKMYELVLGAACQTKQHELVCGILDCMHANGVDSTIGYRNTIRLAFKLGEYDFILELLRLMKEHDIDPTGAYKHQIMSLDNAGLHRQVLDAFEALRKEGCICDENTYGAVVTSAVQGKDRELALSILDDMEENTNLSMAITEVFPRAVRAAICTNQHRLVSDIFDFMGEAGVNVPEGVYVSAIRTAFKSKQYDFVMDILRKMNGSGVSTVDVNEAYTHVVMSFSKAECYDHVLRAFKAMRELGYEQDDVHCTTALRAAIKLNRDDDVVAICNGLGGTAFRRLYSIALKLARAATSKPWSTAFWIT